MSSRLHPEKLRESPVLDRLGLLIDIGMILLVISNLLLIVFDWLFAASTVQQLLARHTPDFFVFYRDTIHADFVFYDLLFVSIYLTEFVVRWGFAIARQTYHRWFFYPFVHWYDLLGCIPVGSFRWLRMLRLISLVYRLQRLGVIDLRDTWLGQTVLKYYRVVVEEISDRVVINVLEGAQREIGQGSPLLNRIERDVLTPRKPALVDFLAGRIISAAQSTHGDYRDRLGSYLSHLTDEALSRTRSGARLAAIPVAGPRAVAMLGESVREVGVALVDQMIEDISHPDHREYLDQLISDLISHTSHGTAGELNLLVRETLIDVLDQVKQQVSVKHWKLDEQQITGKTDGTSVQ
ncbi:hypothetical protein A167_02191 [Alcanivorax sp. S71-1-4]|jgi:hypothetical protein|uniref:ion transporter n=1 Tax=Alcanivorax sp. S71-1-4 TaxID=1177159 RepID=UPI001357FE6C|nr:ion transporter [Alcanivorax sp. S71-1-4]KAF0808981.1 hypothetical protein A167_02191 [Alcanivorax sp. S71-1-4]